MKHVRMTHIGRGPLHTYYYLEWAKVIGNIYDNPELIKRH